MSEDRTQPPSKRRRQLAREQGQVAHSPELTSAAGWLAAVVLLGVMGDDLVLGMIKLVSGSLTDPPVASVDPAWVGGASAGAGSESGVALDRHFGGLRGGRLGGASGASARIVDAPSDRTRPGAALVLVARTGLGCPGRTYLLGTGQVGLADLRLGLDHPRGLGRHPAGPAASRDLRWLV